MNGALNKSIFLLVFALLLLVLSILVLSGRGSALIAGYNTASPEQRARCDESKLCKTVGLMLLTCALSFGAMGCGDLAALCGFIGPDVADGISVVVGVIMVASVPIGTWFACTKCLKSDEG